MVLNIFGMVEILLNLPFDGYGAEVALIDGQALTPSSFAETDALTGQWIPKRSFLF